MNNIIKDVLKNGAIMFAVGALLALAAPPLAGILGGADVLGPEVYSHAVNTPVLWTGAFFGAFGAIHSAVMPAAGLIFGDKGKDETPAISPAPEKSQTPQLNITIQQAPAQPSPQQEQAAEGKWRDGIATQRAAEIAGGPTPAQG